MRQLQSKNKTDVICMYVPYETQNDFMASYHAFEELEQIINGVKRDLVVATQGKDIIGFASLCRNWEKSSNAMCNVLTLTYITVDEEHRNKGVAKQILSMVAEHVLSKGLILRRTQPTDDGYCYIKSLFSQMLNEMAVPYIPYNLDFIFYKLNRDVFPNGTYSTQEKIDLMNEIADETLKHELCRSYHMNSKNDLTFDLMDVSYSLIASIAH